MGAPRKYPLELRERAVRLVIESGSRSGMWRVISVEHAEHETLNWIGFYNTERLHEELQTQGASVAVLRGREHERRVEARRSRS